MTDKEMAVNWIRSQGWSEETLPSDEFGQMLKAFLAGLGAGRPKWHDLRKNPLDLPTENCTVLIYKEVPVAMDEPDISFQLYGKGQYITSVFESFRLETIAMILEGLND